MTESDDIRTPRGVYVSADAMQWNFSRSEGAGGQHVNKTSTKASLTVNLDDVVCSDIQRSRIFDALGDTITVTCQTTRSQWRNRQLCIKQLAEILNDATAPPPAPRKKTKPSRGVRERRLQSKKRDSEKKRNRRITE